MFTAHKLQGAGGVGGDSFELITSNSSTFTEGQTTHTFPSGIQAGDLLVMMQTNAMESAGGNGPAPTLSFGTGFTAAQIAYYQGYYKPSPYSIVNLTVSYKVSNGTESGASIGGFETVLNSNGAPYGTRHVFVFRPSFTHSGNVTVDWHGALTYSSSSTVSSHTASVNLTPSASLPSCGVVLFSSPDFAKVATLSGGLSSFNSSSATSAGSYVTRSIFRGGFVCDAGTPQINAVGPANTTAPDNIFIYTFTLS